MSAATRPLRAVVGRSYRLSRAVARARMARAVPTGASPLVVCSMGKTGSTALARALADATGEHVFQVFRLDRVEAEAAERRYRAAHPTAAPGPVPFPGALHLWESAFLARRPPRPDAPWRVIVPVREPVAQAVSAFFHALDGRGVTTIDPASARRDLLDEGWLERPARWFDREIGPTLGIDVYAVGPAPVAMPVEVSGAGVRLLVVRLEDAATTPAALGRFLGRPGPVPVPARNEASGRRYADAYGAFVAAPGLPAAALDAAYGSEYARYFYSASEIAAFRTRWGAPDRR
ncbi:MAG: putative capsular polysaccharide synthesis family protein [Actinomycetota bacterium]